MLHTRLMQWIALTTAVLCTLWFSPTLLDPFNIPKLAILIVGSSALLALIVGYVRQWWSRDEIPALAATLLFLGCMGAAGLASDQSAYRTLWGAWARNTGFLAYAAMAIVMVSVAIAFRGRSARFVQYGLIAVGLFNAFYGLFQITGNDPINWNNSYNPIIGTVGNPNFSAALMGIAAISTFWVALDPAFSTGTRIAAGIGTAYLVVIIYLTDSMQGLLVFAIGAVIVLGAWLTLHPNSRIQHLIWPLGTVSLLSGVGVILGALQIGPLTKFIFQQSVLYRSDYYAAAIEMMKVKPALGVGLDSYGDWFRIVRSPIQVARRGPDIVSNAAHNVVLQIGATAGIVTLIAYLLLCGVVLWRLGVGLKNPQTRLLAGGLGGAWLGFFAQSLVSIDQLGLAVWGWMLSGAIVATPLTGNEGMPPNRRQRRRVKTGASFINIANIGIASVVGVTSVAVVSGPLGTDAKVREVAAYKVEQQNTAQVVALTTAVQELANDAPDPYWQATLVNSLYANGAVEPGIEVAKQASKLFPADVALWQLVATAYEQTGRKAEAIPYRAKTVSLDPLNENYSKLLAEDQAVE